MIRGVNYYNPRGRIMVHQFLVDNFPDQVFMIFFFLNYILLMLAYKLGFPQKIHVLNSVIIYILLAIDTVIVSLIGGIAELPTVDILVLLIFVLAIYRFRMYNERKANQTE